MKKILKIADLAVFAVLAIAVLTFVSQANASTASELAPVGTCPGQTEEGISPQAQAETMLCMTNFARSANGLKALSSSKPLGRAADQKSADIANCDEFSHEACGHPFTFWAQRYGYMKGCWKAAENIAWGTGTESTVRAIFTAWLQSPEHHANILGPYAEIGIAMRVGGVEGNRDAAIWTQDFGSHSC